MSDNTQQQSIFRKKALERISSPEQLTDYLRVTNPGIWVVLATIILLLASLVAWSSIGTLETTAEVKVIVSDHIAQVISPGGAVMKGGMILRVSGQEVLLASEETDEYGRSVGTAELSLPDGTYDGVIVTEQIRPISFLLKGG